MNTMNKMSLYHTLSALDEKNFDLVWKVLKELTIDTIEIEKLSDKEAKEYEDGFAEIECGEYKNLEQIKAERVAT
ncbi:hypothetical protein FACS1894132_00690 [Clostridia bacterium]|nr:hypothetical protein FACS1894132_00690 [Clostridia bacterium]